MKLVSLGSALVVMLSVMEDAGGVELDSCPPKQSQGVTRKMQQDVLCTSSRPRQDQLHLKLSYIINRHARNKGMKRV